MNPTNEKGKSKRHSVLLPILVMVVILALLGGTIYFVRKHAQDVKDKAAAELTIPERVFPVETIITEKAQYTKRIEGPGTIAAVHSVTVKSETDGRVIRLPVEVGDLLKPGDLILSVDDRKKRLAVDQAEAALRAAEANAGKIARDLKRMKTLFDNGDITDSEYEGSKLACDMAEAGFEQAEVALKMAEEILADTRITAPVKGRVTARYVETGDLLSPGVPVLDLLDLTEMKIMFSLSEEEISFVKPGDEASFTLDAYPGREFQAKVRTLIPRADMSTRTFPLDLRYENTEGISILPGMVARVRMAGRDSGMVLLVPKDAVLERGGKRVLFVTKDNKAVMKEIVLGDSVAAQWLIESGLSEGEQLIVVGNSNLDDGSAISIQNVK